MLPERSFRVISQTRVGWDVATRRFIIYYCVKHDFYPDPVTLENKCFQRKCRHLYSQMKKDILVENLREALAIKRVIGNVQIEQVANGYHITLIKFKCSISHQNMR